MVCCSQLPRISNETRSAVVTQAPQPSPLKGRQGGIFMCTIAVLFVGLVVSSCVSVSSSLSGGRTNHFYCPYDTVWEETLMALHPATFAVADKEDGVIETEWEEGMSKAQYGVFGRSNLVQERSSIVVNLDQQDKLTKVHVIHARQVHHLSGRRSLRWLHAEPLPHVENKILSRIQNRLKNQGCRLV